MGFADPLGLVGQRLGPYVVREVVTMGGVAVIYRGEHEALKSAVAVKVLRPELVEDGARPTLEQMFLREAQILSQLRSDDILRAVDHGRVVCAADGAERPYIVVDWLEGHPLSDELERRARGPRRPYTLQEALELLEPIARALAVCHESGIVHRDVNPRNVFLENMGPGRPPRAKLIDFGFAKEVARTEALRLQRVDGTLLARSPDYAAPEHYDRETYGDLSENTDIYTFALMLVEMLTLEPPLRGMTDADLKEATTNRADRPTPNNRGGHVSAGVEALFAEALAIDQFERPGILLEFWERLKAAAKVAAEPPDQFAPGPEAPRGVPRKGIGKALVAMVTVSTLGAAGALGLYWRTRPLECPAGFSDCNGKRSDGCEAELRGDPSNCGTCGIACGGGHGSSSCVEGRCRITRCSASHLGDCNQTAGDGCETDLRADQKNCGECGRVCGLDGARQALCADSKCLIACRSGSGDCDDRPENGCEASLASDPKNCGRCGVACSDGECKDGLCAPKVLASPVTARFLAIHDGRLYFWDAEKHRIERVAPDGQRSVVVDDARDVAGLAIGAGRVVWTAGENAGLFTRPLEDGRAPVERIAASLAGPTPLALSANGYVSWANRAARSESDGTKKRRPRAELPPPALRRVFASAFDSVLDEGKRVAAECPEWPRTFAADGRGVYCCDESKPLSLVECAADRCTSRPYDAICPGELAMDDGRLYFGQDVRVLTLDRKTGALRALARRKKRPRAVTLGAGYLYWFEGDRQSELWRVTTDSAEGVAPELLARRQTGASALAADGNAVYWTADAPEGANAARGPAIYRVSLRGH